MIRLWDGYAISADEYNIVLGIPKTTVDKDGKKKDCMYNASYHSSVGSALLAFAKKKQREYIMENDVTVQEAVEAFLKIETRILMVGGTKEKATEEGE